MKKAILSLSFVAAALTAATITLSAADQRIPKKTLNPESKVYICMSKGSYAYHADRNCEFLLKCSVKWKKRIK